MPPSQRRTEVDKKMDSIGAGGIASIAIVAVLLGLQLGVGVKAFVSNVYLVNAVAAQAQDEVEIARWSFYKTLQWNDADYRAQFWLGLSQRDENEDAAAAVSFNTCLRLAPSHVQSMLELGELYAEAGDFDEADRLFEGAARLVPDFWRVHESVGFREGLAGNHRAALEEFERALALSRGRRGNLAYQMAVAYLALDDRRMALAHAKRAVEGDPGTLQNYILLAKAYLAMGVPDKSIDVLARMIEAGANDQRPVSASELYVFAEGYVLSSEAHWMAGRMAESAEALLIASQFAPGSEAFRRGARSFAERSEDLSRTRFSSEAEHGRSLYQFGKALAAAGEVGTAVSLFEAALASGLAWDLRVDGAVSLAALYRDLDRPEEALRVLQDARSAVPPDARLDIALGEAFELIGRPAEARLHYLEVLQRYQLDALTESRVESKLSELGGLGP